MEFVVDLQGFKQSGNDFILKELAILPLNEDSEPLVFLFKPPFDWKRINDKYRKENLWLKHYYHGIPWNSGDYPYTEIGNILRSTLHNSTKIFVEGSIKKEWLKRFRFNVIDISEIIATPTLERLHKEKLFTVCTNHVAASKPVCALHNVKLMKKFYQDYVINKNSESMDYE